jgi:hypothetical protein
MQIQEEWDYPNPGLARFVITLIYIGSFAFPAYPIYIAILLILIAGYFLYRLSENRESLSPYLRRKFNCRSRIIPTRPGGNDGNQHILHSAI